MSYVILIMGLPGSGKTTLATELQRQLEERKSTVKWYNADRVRDLFADWDFSENGRIRQARRMRSLADASIEDYVIIDFVAPMVRMREIVNPDCLVWVDTIAAGRYEDTNKLFAPPTACNFRVTEQNAEAWAKCIINELTSLRYKD